MQIFLRRIFSAASIAAAGYFPLALFHRLTLCLLGTLLCLCKHRIGAHLRGSHNFSCALVCASARRRHQPFGFATGLPHHFVALAFCVLKLLLRKRCYAHTFGYFVAAFIDDAKDGFVEQVRERGEEQAKIHRLYQKQVPIDTECGE